MEVRIVSAGDIAKCPAGSLLPSHYDDNGNCECKNSEYTVKWEIELIADDPEQAARSALALLRNPDSCTSVFTVTRADGRSWKVDLLDDEKVQELP